MNLLSSTRPFCLLLRTSYSLSLPLSAFLPFTSSFLVESVSFLSCHFPRLFLSFFFLFFCLFIKKKKENRIRDMYSTVLQSPGRDGRRVLGEKPANSSLSPAGKLKAGGLKHAHFEALPNSSLKSTARPSPPLPVTRKRSIDQVDDAGEANVQFPEVSGLHLIYHWTAFQLQTVFVLIY